jgi:hypothetical protein
MAIGDYRTMVRFYVQALRNADTLPDRAEG